MKKSIIAMVAAVAFAASSYGQGTVAFNNAAGSLVTYGPGGPNAGGSSLAVGNQILLGLYWGAAGSTEAQLVQIGGTTTIAPSAGRYSGGQRTTGVATAPGATAVFQVRAWSASMGATYEEALTAAGGYRGTSTLFSSTTGGVGSPASPAVPLSLTVPGFSVAFIPVPEPSVVALAVLGVGALLFRRRKA